MPVRFYLDKRQNRYREAPIRVVWSFNGDRYQTTMGFSIPPESWNEPDCRVTPAAYNHKNTASTTINAFISSMEKAVNRMENYARVQNATLTKPIVQKVISDVLAAGGEFIVVDAVERSSVLRREVGHHHIGTGTDGALAPLRVHGSQSRSGWQ